MLRATPPPTSNPAGASSSRSACRTCGGCRPARPSGRSPSRPTYVGFDEYTDFVSQICYSHHYRVVGDQLDVFSAPFRYVWPSELDLMALLAGMTLRERWSDWNRQPFTGESTSHVSVWEKRPVACGGQSVDSVSAIVSAPPLTPTVLNPRRS